MEETVFSETSVVNSNWQMLAILIAILLALILFAVLIVWLKRRLTRPELYGMSREQIKKRWLEVRATSKISGQMGMKMAIVEADTLLDSALKGMMMPGETLGERLKVACYKYPKLRDVWFAHKMRNNLVHDSSFKMSSHDAKRALDLYEQALRVLNVLD